MNDPNRKQATMAMVPYVAPAATAAAKTAPVAESMLRLPKNKTLAAVGLGAVLATGTRAVHDLSQKTAHNNTLDSYAAHDQSLATVNHVAGHAARSGGVGTAIGAVAGAILSKGHLSTTGAGAVVGGTVGAITGINDAVKHATDFTRGVLDTLPPDARPAFLDALQKGAALDDALAAAWKVTSTGLHGVGHVIGAATKLVGKGIVGVADLDIQGAARKAGEGLANKADAVNKQNLGYVAGAASLPAMGIYLKERADAKKRERHFLPMMM
jgi:hypothetical protein